MKKFASLLLVILFMFIVACDKNINKNVCVHCGEEVLEEASFCAFCGTSLNDDVSRVDSSIESKTESTTSTEANVSTNSAVINTSSITSTSSPASTPSTDAPSTIKEKTCAICGGTPVVANGYCANCKCPRCNEKKRYPEDAGCVKHNCTFVSCHSLTAIQYSSYCFNHKCENASCINGKSNNRWCVYHTCYTLNCNEERVAGSQFCFSHKCANSSCKNKKVNDSIYCNTHK